jgi:CHASE3 domain sensor protein
MPLLGGLVLVLLAIAVAVFLSIEQQRADRWVRESMEVESQLNQVQTIATDAETGQRGYLLTGRLSYLEPYEIARQQLDPQIDFLASETSGNPAQKRSIANLRALVDRKLAELQETIDLQSAGRTADALAIINNDTGKALMSDIRHVVADMRDEELRVTEERSARASWLDGIGRAALAGCVLLVVAVGAFALADARRRILELQSINRSWKRRERRGRPRKIRSGNFRKCRRSDSSRAASRTTSTTCWRS